MIIDYESEVIKSASEIKSITEINGSNKKKHVNMSKEEIWILFQQH